MRWRGRGIRHTAAPRPLVERVFLSAITTDLRTGEESIVTGPISLATLATLVRYDGRDRVSLFRPLATADHEGLPLASAPDVVAGQLTYRPASVAVDVVLKLEDF